MYNVRLAKLQDCDQIQELWEILSIDHLKKAKCTISEKQMEKYGYERLVNSESCIILVAENEEAKIVAFAEIYTNMNKTIFLDGKSAYVLHTLVLPEYRTSRVLLDMLEKLEEILKERGITYICADVYMSNHRFYNNIRFLDFEPYKTRFVRKINV